MSSLAIVIVVAAVLVLFACDQVVEAQTRPHSSSSSPSRVVPIILVPGIAGSQLQVRLNESYEAPHWYCRHGRAQPAWEHCWFDLTDYVSTECLAHELHVGVSADGEGGLRYDNSKGVEVRAVDFGGVEGIKCLDPIYCSLTEYFAPVIDLLVENGYVLNETLFGAPYDFRLAGDGLEQNGFYEDLTSLIERIGEPVILLPHSMGSMVVINYLAGKPKSWTDAYISGIVSVSGPYGGSPLSLQGSISGDPIGLPFYHDAFLDIQDNSPSGPWLFPASGLWQQQEILVRTRTRNYTASPEDYLLLLTELNRSEQAKAFPIVRNDKGIHYDAKEGPFYPQLNIKRLLALHGKGTKTPASLYYDVDQFTPNQDPPAPHYTRWIDGDGVVDYKSLEYCKSIPGASVVAIQGQNHVGILSSKELHQQLLNFIFADVEEEKMQQ